MTLNPRFAGQKMGGPPTVHTLELFLDYVCPFSQKMFTTVHDSTLPLIQTKYANKVQIILRQQIQPWHPSSTLTHEAGAAVLKTQPDKFWQFSRALFAKQTEFFDASVVREARNETYRRLARVAASVGVDGERVYALLEVSERPAPDGGLNVGNAVTDDVKLMVKVGFFPRVLRFLCVRVWG
ncbi:hypothetical protein MBLNU230_g6618t1 [Neophaeotheca triangularis]